GRHPNSRTIRESWRRIWVSGAATTGLINAEPKRRSSGTGNHPGVVGPEPGIDHTAFVPKCPTLVDGMGDRIAAVPQPQPNLHPAAEIDRAHHPCRPDVR